MLGSLLAQIDESWLPLFASYQFEIAAIDELIKSQRITPNYENVFRVFRTPLSTYRCVILGQDPYQTPGYATGLAFSVDPEKTKLPPSLKNIFSEYVADTGFSLPKNGDLTNWATNGVLLLNSSLTLNLDDKAEHLKIGWQRITTAVLELMASRGCVAILWGSHAQIMGSVFAETRKVVSAHPSPLSAYRGFFGSKPFSNCNRLLKVSGQEEIDWHLG